MSALRTGLGLLHKAYGRGSMCHSEPTTRHPPRPPDPASARELCDIVNQIICRKP